MDEQRIVTLHQGLVDHLKQNGRIVTPSIEAAFRAVPRHLFLPGVALEEVYQDQVIATKSLNESLVSSSSQPTIMAIMLEQLQLQPGQCVLEIGAGTGYNAALMAHIVGETGQVVTIDIDEDIVAGAREHLATAGFERVQVILADGFAGYAAAAPYDRIILTVHAADIAPAWREQLRSDGRLVLPLSIRGPQVSVAFEPVDNYLASISLNACGFIGLRGAMAEYSHYVHLLRKPELLFLHFTEPQTVDARRVQQWLAGVGKDRRLPIQVTYRELFYGIGFWLALHEPMMCGLVGQLTPTTQDVLRTFFPYGGKGTMRGTVGLLSERGLCVLMREPAANIAADISQDLLPFTLWIRSFGKDLTLADYFGALLMQWHSEGRPCEQQLRIKAYPQGVDYVHDKDEMVIAKRWTHFLFKW